MGQIYAALNDDLTDAIPELEIVSGGAAGVDTFGEQWAYEANVDVKRFPAQWHKYGRSAGHRRNADMARYADRLIAFWDGQSKGTENMIRIMVDLKKPTTVYYADDFEQVGGNE